MNPSKDIFYMAFILSGISPTWSLAQICDIKDIPETVDLSHSPSDRDVPVFGRDFQKCAVQNGNWTDGKTWEPPGPPGANDNVYIPAGRQVLIGNTWEAICNNMVLMGTLEFERNSNTNLQTAGIFILPSGVLKAGDKSSKQPMLQLSQIVIRNLPLELNDREQHSRGILVAGGEIHIYGKHHTPYIELSAEANSGDDILYLSAQPQNWDVGMNVIIPDSYARTWDEPNPGFGEVREIAEVLSDPPRIRLAQGLSRTHPGARDRDDQLVRFPHMALLSRTFNIQSEGYKAGEIRGHFLAGGRSKVHIENVYFYSMGRTTNEPLNPVTNHIGRYALHMHHHFGPEKPEGPYQYQLIGNLIQDAQKWGITVHNSHYGLIQNNVVYHAGGAGVTTEDGSESFNVFDANLVVGVYGTAERGKWREEPPGSGVGVSRLGDGFWFAGVNNYIRNNIVSGARLNGYNIYGAANEGPWVVMVPNFQGADPHHDGTPTDMGHIPIREFRNNTVYQSFRGLEFWYIGFENYYFPYQDVGQTVIDGFKSWHVAQRDIFGNQQANILFRGVRIYGNKNIQNGYNFPTAINLLQGRSIVLQDVEVHNVRTGFALEGYMDRGGTIDEVPPVEIRDSLFACEAGISILPAIIDIAGGIPPRRTEIRNSRFSPITGQGNYTGINMGYRCQGPANLRLLDRVKVWDFQGVKGDNFNLFYYQQAPDFGPLPRDGDCNVFGLGGVIACPSAGMTNQQCWDAHQVWLFGEPHPKDVTTRPNVSGLVQPF